MKNKAKKGCINPDCEMNKKKKHFHKKDLFCPRCGTQLSLVCEKCHGVLEDADTKFCVNCQIQKDDNEEKTKNFLKKAAGVVPMFVPAAIMAINKNK